MRDQGLEEAIRAAGGVSELARQLGISQPSVSNWTRIPAERVVADRIPHQRTAPCAAPRSLRRTEFVGGTRRSRGRARARICAARVAPLAHAECRIAVAPRQPARRRHAARRRACRSRRSREPRRSRQGRARVLQSLYRRRPQRAPALRAPIISPASCTSGRSRACAKISPRSGSSAAKAMPSRKITREFSARSWPGLIDGRLPAPAGTDQKIFEKHMAPWIGRFFADLERCESADFYRRVGTLGRLFIEIETEAFSLAA